MLRRAREGAYLGGIHVARTAYPTTQCRPHSWKLQKGFLSAVDPLPCFPLQSFSTGRRMVVESVPKVVVDVDTGIDDAWGLCLLLSAHERGEVQILGVTCVDGNTSVENVYQNTARVLKTAGLSQIPIYKGASTPLIPTEKALSSDDLESFFGKNGFGDVPLPPEELPEAQSENAVVALNRIVNTYEGEVTLVCCAPLTNIALAIRTFPNFVSSVKDVYIMGGNYTALGNTTMCAEFNAHHDPEASHIVLSSFWKKIVLLPWETCLSLKIPYEWREEFGQTKGDCIQLLNTIETPVIQRAKRLGYTHWINCDQLLAAIVINKSIIKDMFYAHATVELSGLYTRGQVVLDHLNVKEHNIKIIKSVDENTYKSLLTRLKGFPCF